MGKDFFSFRDEEVKNLGRGDVKGYWVKVKVGIKI